MKQTVLILSTGGTIEKSYSEDDGSILNRAGLLKQKLAAKLRLPYTEIQVQEVMRKDSLDMTEEDRDIIHKEITAGFAQKNPIVILHGTDTMAETLKLCCVKTPQPPVPVVFTGAMRPAGFDDSDALQNFTEALYASQTISPGFYLSFHGHLFKGPKVRKNRDTRTFEVE